MARTLRSFLSGGNILKTWRRRCCVTVQAAAKPHLPGLWGKCLRALSHSFAHEQALGSECRKRWKMAGNIQYKSQREGFYYPLHLQNKPNLLEDDQNPLPESQGTHVKRSSSSALSQIMYSLLQRLYHEQDNPTLSMITFQMKSWCVRTLPSLERTILLPDLFTGKHTGQGSFSVPAVLYSAQEPLSYFPSPLHEVLKGGKLMISSPSAFRGFPSIFLLPFSFLCTALHMEASGSKRIIS